MLLNKLSVTLLSFVLIVCLSITCIFGAEVYLGGESIGIKLDYEGILISGTYDISIDNKTYNPSSDGYQKGDLITHVNNQRVKTINELMEYIEAHLDNKVFQLTLIRNNTELKKNMYISINNDQFSTGLYVQDRIAGIGTITYYNPSDMSFGALGHIMDAGDGCDIVAENGYIYRSYVNGIVESKKGDPGEKIADIDSVDIGQVSDNNAYGIYGKYYQDIINKQQVIKTASPDEIKKGKAYFLTVIEGNKLHKCEINITDINDDSSSKLKGITFQLTDKYVIGKTNGVVQGMSGSPIIQNGKLIGAVNHVLVNDPLKGYGVFIETMLEVSKSNS